VLHNNSQPILLFLPASAAENINRSASQTYFAIAICGQRQLFRTTATDCWQVSQKLSSYATASESLCQCLARFSTLQKPLDGTAALMEVLTAARDIVNGILAAKAAGHAAKAAGDAASRAAGSAAKVRSSSGLNSHLSHASTVLGQCYRWQQHVSWFQWLW